MRRATANRRTIGNRGKVRQQGSEERFGSRMSYAEPLPTKSVNKLLD